MDEWLRDSAPLRMALLYGSMLAVAVAELRFGVRRNVRSIARRWTSNIALMVFSPMFVRAVLPAGGIAAALWAEEQGFGLLRQLDLSPTVALLVGLATIDLGHYLTHRINHAVPWLWRLHRVHHADPELDFSTAHRHHPVAVVFSTVAHAAWVLATGLPAGSILLAALFQPTVEALVHGNLRYPARVERVLRWLVVTPTVHKVHHSSHQPETDSNYGGLFTVWDRLFGTYRDDAQSFEAGLEDFRDDRDLDFDRLIVQPLRSASRG